MKLGKRLRNNILGTVVGVILTVGVGVIFTDFNFRLSTRLRNVSYDLPFGWRPVFERIFEGAVRDTPDDVAMVYMDDVSYDTLDQSYIHPWDRLEHAKLIDRMTEEGARAVIFDIIFSDPSPDGPEVDRRLADAMEKNGKICLAAELVQSYQGTGEAPLERLLPPEEAFDLVCAEIGFSALRQDADLSVRRHYHQAEYNELFESLSWATTRFLGYEIAQNPSNREVERWVNYYGKPRTLNDYSYHEVVTPNSLPKGTFKDKIVFVGAHLNTYNAGERKDEFLNPWARADDSNRAFMPGVEIHSTILLNLIHEDWLVTPSLENQRNTAIVMGIIAGIILVNLSPLIATLVAVMMALAYTGSAFYMHTFGRLWFPWAFFVVIQLPLALGFSVVFNSIKLFLEKRLLEQSIRAYLSPKLVKAFANRPDENFLKPGATKQELSILFSDIEGFTSLSEGMDSSELAELMNGYFDTTVSSGIHATDGTVVKYIGDAIFAFWNAPEPQSDHATRSCQAAIEIQNQPYKFSDDKPVNTRVGIHTGVADVGNFGSKNRVDYTAIGENINLASRLEGLNKYVGTRILISVETQEAADDSIVTRDLGYFRLKGFEKTVHVYEVLGNTEAIRQESAARVEQFEKALATFQNREFADAESQLNALLKTWPDDGPSAFLLKQMKALDLATLPQDWQGEIQLDEK